MNKQQIIKTLPHLEVVAIDKLLTYENFDNRRTTYLYHKIIKDGLFKNPILVGGFKNKQKHYVVLDGVNRIEALRRLKIKYVVAQVVDYFDDRQINLLSNHHFFFKHGSQLFKQIKQLTNNKLSPMTLSKAMKNLDGKKIIGLIKVKGRVYGLGRHVSLAKTAEILNKLVDIYLNKLDFCRYSEVQGDLLGADMEIIFYRFTPREIVHLAKNKKILNSGITYHLPAFYSLGVDFPLGYLRGQNNLSVKNKLLKQHIINLVKNRKYRYYSRPIHVFNDTAYLTNKTDR